VSSYVSGNATDQNRFGANIDHCLSRLCYGLRRYLSGLAPVMLRHVAVCPDKPRVCPCIDDRAPVLTCVSTASHGSRVAKPKCYTVAYK